MTGEEILLLRPGAVVSSFAGAFGSKVKETRLTAILGYLIALEPKLFCDEFKIHGEIESVVLEAPDDRGRSDILIKSSDGLGVVEAKIDATNPSKQAQQYAKQHHAKWQVLLTEFLPTPEQKKNPGITYCCWRDIAKLIQENSKFLSPKARFIGQDLIMYLKEHHMIPDDDLDEIYTRDINDDYSANMFLKGHVYGCQYNEGSRLFKTHYFAPYFGKNISASKTVQALHPDMKAGVSYIAKIIDIQTSETPTDFEAIAKELRKKHNRKKEWSCSKAIKEFFGGQRCAYCFIFLDEPRLAFDEPIQKRYLQKSPKYTLAQKLWSFDAFYRAWERQKKTHLVNRAHSD
jgi:hypothetical protein